MSGDKDGWPCPCGNIVDPHLLTCPKCNHTLTLDKALAGLVAEVPSPPMDEWVRDAKAQRIFSPESMEEVLAQAAKRKKSAEKRRRQRKSQQRLNPLAQLWNRSFGKFFRGR